MLLARRVADLSGVVEGGKGTEADLQALNAMEGPVMELIALLDNQHFWKSASGEQIWAVNLLAEASETKKSGWYRKALARLFKMQDRFRMQSEDESSYGEFLTTAAEGKVAEVKGTDQPTAV